MKIALSYLLFAAIATFANIASQELSIQLYGGSQGVLISVLIGTGVGLVVKYALDKRYIFQFRDTGWVHNSQTFVLYAIMGIVTTAVFWGFEFGFDYFFGTKEMRYLGAVTGLAIGYLVKYQLDKRYVFVTSVEDQKTSARAGAMVKPVFDTEPGVQRCAKLRTWESRP